MFHSGETIVQRKAHMPEQATDWVLGPMSPQEQKFYSQLQYLFFGYLDQFGRPWCSILAGPTGFMSVKSPGILHLTSAVHEDDPIVAMLSNSQHPEELHHFAATGVMLHNRRRNKLAGEILRNTVLVTPATNNSRNVSISFDIAIHQSYGNCPKYITVRDIDFVERIEKRVECKVIHMELEAQLPSECIHFVLNCDSLYLSTRHLNDQLSDARDMDTNHRGGNTGFVRVTEDKRSIVIPDYSGNRFFQSLGNIETDGLAGIVIPDYDTGNILYLTGKAVNYFDEAAQRIMPFMNRLTMITVTGYVWIKSGLNLLSRSAPVFSPYNPPIKYLAFENSKLTQAILRYNSNQNDPVAGPITATFIKYRALTSTISQYTIELSSPIVYNPGQYIILDFSQSLKLDYHHMMDSDPKYINDDLIRSWTITSYPPCDVLTNQILPSTLLTITVKRKKGGILTSALRNLCQSKSPVMDPLENIRFLGVEGQFSCWDKTRPKASKILFLAGGIGITPFLAIVDGLSKIRGETKLDIILFFSCNGYDVKMIDYIYTEYRDIMIASPVQIHIFDSTATATSTSFESNSVVGRYNRRLELQDMNNVLDILDRSIYLCGPEQYMTAARHMLAAVEMKSVDSNGVEIKLGIDSKNLFTESFVF